jgi:hypothetical protein
MRADMRAECPVRRPLCDDERKSVAKRPLELPAMIFVPMCLLAIGLVLLVLPVLNDGHNVPSILIRGTTGTAATVAATLLGRNANDGAIFSR